MRGNMHDSIANHILEESSSSFLLETSENSYSIQPQNPQLYHNIPQAPSKATCNTVVMTQ